MGPDTAPGVAADCVVGLVTHNHAMTVGPVVRAAREALDALAPARGLIIVADHESTDGTLERAREAAGGTIAEVSYARHPSDALDVPYHGLPGRARALQALLREARAHGARACVVVDARAGGFARNWILALEQLAGEALDFVTPFYQRHPAGAGLLNGLVYPVSRALYGARLRSPAATEFGCSARLIDVVLPDPVWDADWGQRAIDLWLPTAAVAGGFRIGEVAAGPRPSYAADVDVATTVAQVIGALFADIERRVAVWQRVRGSKPVPIVGTVPETPGSPDVDPAPLVESFRLAHGALQDVWAEVLPPMAILQWRRLATQPLDAFRVDEALWARTIYDFAMGHRLRVIAREHLLRSLTPMYLAWLGSFVQAVRHVPAAEAEARIEHLCLAFEAEKPYLISQWRWPDRFRPVKLRR